MQNDILDNFYASLSTNNLRGISKRGYCINVSLAIKGM